MVQTRTNQYVLSLLQQQTTSILAQVAHRTYLYKR